VMRDVSVDGGSTRAGAAGSATGAGAGVEATASVVAAGVRAADVEDDGRAAGGVFTAGCFVRTGGAALGRTASTGSVATETLFSRAGAGVGGVVSVVGDGEMTASVSCAAGEAGCDAAAAVGALPRPVRYAPAATPVTTASPSTATPIGFENILNSWMCVFEQFTCLGRSPNFPTNARDDGRRPSPG
jgi:hypothetical protein